MNRHVAVTIPVRRRGLFSLVAPIPPATITFRAAAVVHEAAPLEKMRDPAAARAHVPVN